jgi:hypothetical protein
MAVPVVHPAMPIAIRIRHARSAPSARRAVDQHNTVAESPPTSCAMISSRMLPRLLSNPEAATATTTSTNSNFAIGCWQLAATRGVQRALTAGKACHGISQRAGNQLLVR